LARQWIAALRGCVNAVPTEIREWRGTSGTRRVCRAEYAGSGTWQVEYHDKNGKETDTPMVTILQNGGRLDGVFGKDRWKVEGTVVGDQVQFSFHPPQRPDITVRYQGTLESNN